MVHQHSVPLAPGSALLRAAFAFGVMAVWFAVGMMMWALYIVLFESEALSNPDAMTLPGMAGFNAFVAFGWIPTGILLTTLLPQRRRIVEELALIPPRWIWIAVGLMAGCLGWTYDAWVQEVVSQGLGLDREIRADDMVKGNALLTVLMLGLFAPIGEEFVARGYVWQVLRRAFPPLVVVVLTGVFFAMLHVNLLHTLTLAPVGILYGIIRWRSGSLWPCLVAHIVNNAVVLFFSFSTLDDGFDLVPWPLAVGCCTLVLSSVAAASWWAPSVEPDPPWGIWNES